MSPNVYLCIVLSIRIAYCFVRIAILSYRVFFRIDPALLITVKCNMTRMLVMHIKPGLSY